MPNYKTPGVYVEEISTLPSSIVPVSTAIPAFIGYTEKANDPNDSNISYLNTAIRINSFLEYKLLFGDPAHQGLRVSVVDGSPDKVVALSSPVSPYSMYYQVLMYFRNGGGPCYIISVGLYDDSGLIRLEEMGEAADGTGGLDIVEKVDEVTLLVFPEAVFLPDSQYVQLYQQALAQCQKLKDRFTIIDIKGTLESDASGSPVDYLRDNLGSNFLSYGAAYYPYLITSLSYPYDPLQYSFVDQEGNIAAVDLDNTQFTAALERLVSSYPIQLAPSGSIAGVYAQTDRIRGVFKAPANVSLSGVIAPLRQISNEVQEGLNVDPVGGKSINAIRSFAGKGVLVWGARTLAGNDNEWRYVSVRRFFIFAEESIKKALAIFVFEPNDEDTWISVKGMIENFLISQWQAGALVGSTAEQAFYVNIGLGQTMSSQDVLEGRLIVEIGMAVARPAEFIILKFIHKLQEA